MTKSKAEQKRIAATKRKKAEAEARQLKEDVLSIDYRMQRARAEGREDFTVPVEPMRRLVAALESELEIIRQQRREAREKRKYLRDLTNAVTLFLNRLEVVMKEPSTETRGRRIAKLSNDLDMANDIARHFGLDVKLESLSKGKS